MEMLGKHTGAFEKHQKQKYTAPEDVATIRKRLEEADFDCTAANRRSVRLPDPASEN